MGTSRQVVQKWTLRAAEANRIRTSNLRFTASVKNHRAWRVAQVNDSASQSLRVAAVAKKRARRCANLQFQRTLLGTPRWRCIARQTSKMFGFPTVLFLTVGSRPIAIPACRKPRHSRRSHRLPRPRDAIARALIHLRSKYFRLARM